MRGCIKCHGPTDHRRKCYICDRDPSPVLKDQPGPPPEMCPECTNLIEESNLHWVKCGGISVGMNTSPLVWRLRDKDERFTVQQRTKDLQRIAGAARLIHQLTATIKKQPLSLEDQELVSQAERWLKNKGEL